MAAEKTDRARGAMAGHGKRKSRKKHSSKKKTIREMHIRGTKNGKFVVKHDMHPQEGVGQEPEEHGADDKEALMAHLDQHAESVGPQEPEAQPQAQDQAAQTV